MAKIFFRLPFHNPRKALFFGRTFFLTTCRKAIKVPSSGSLIKIFYCFDRGRDLKKKRSSSFHEEMIHICKIPFPDFLLHSHLPSREQRRRRKTYSPRFVCEKRNFTENEIKSNQRKFCVSTLWLSWKNERQSCFVLK